MGEIIAIVLPVFGLVALGYGAGLLGVLNERANEGLTAYLFVIADSVLLVISGLVLWKSVQFPLLRELLGGYEAARRIHFFAMAGLMGFLLVHLAMVALVPRSLRRMILGR